MPRREPKCKPSDDYSRWAATVMRDARTHRVANSDPSPERLLDRAPRGSGVLLAAYFLGLTDDELCTCWAACVLDLALEMTDPHELARPLLVVKHRLAARRSR